MGFSKLLALNIAFFTVFSVIICSTSASEHHHNALDPFLDKKYELSSSQNDKFDAILKALGVNWLKRKAYILAKPEMKLSRSGNKYTLSLHAFFKDIDTTFEMGHEFPETTIDGRKVKTVFTEHGTTLSQIQRGAKTLTIDRKFTKENVTVTVRLGNLKCIRIYKAQ